jgi:hypothetical protein
MDRVRTFLAALDRSDFSVLGRLYLAPGRWLAVTPSEYLVVLVAGAAWIAAAGWIAWRIFRRGTPASASSDPRAAGSLFRAALVLYLGAGAYVTLVYPPTSDEPHYLNLAESLVADGDIRLADNYARGDYLRFYPVSGIDPHTVVTPDGEMYSQHTIGLPLLVLPGYAIAGRWGSLLILALVAAALAPALYRLCRRAGVASRAAHVTVGLTAATAPLAFASTLVFTDVPAALLAATALAGSSSVWIPAACASALPWLHPRFAAIAAGLLAVNLLRSRNRAGVLGIWAGAAAASGAVFFAVYHGAALVSALNVLTERYPARLDELSGTTIWDNIALRFLLPGIFAKLLDRDFGVLAFAPWLVVLLPGIVVAARRRKFPHADLVLGGGAYALITCLYRNWAGSAYPGRTLVALLPFAIPYLGVGVEWALGGRARARSLAALAAVAIATAWLLTAIPVLRYTSGREWMAAKAGVSWRVLPFTWFPSCTLERARDPGRIGTAP